MSIADIIQLINDHERKNRCPRCSNFRTIERLPSIPYTKDTLASQYRCTKCNAVWIGRPGVDLWVKDEPSNETTKE